MLTLYNYIVNFSGFMNFKKYLFIFILIVFLPSLVYSSGFSLDLETPSDSSQNTFYIPKSGNFQIYFKNTLDLDTKIYPDHYKVVYSYKVFDIENNLQIDSLSSLDLSLSHNEVYFFSENTSKISLNIFSKGFSDDKLLVEIISKVYDSKNNLISQNREYIRLISNNSEVYYPETYNKSEPAYRGHNISEDKILIYNDTNASYKINLFTENNFSYDVICKLSSMVYENDFIFLKDFNKEDNSFIFTVSKNIKQDLDSGKYIIKCNAYNKSHNYSLKNIELIYLNANFVHINLEEPLVPESKSNDFNFRNIFNNLKTKIKNI